MTDKTARNIFFTLVLAIAIAAAAKQTAFEHRYTSACERLQGSTSRGQQGELVCTGAYGRILLTLE